MSKMLQKCQKIVKKQLTEGAICDILIKPSGTGRAVRLLNRWHWSFCEDEKEARASKKSP